MNESQNNDLVYKILDFLLPASFPSWGLIFFIFSSNFVYLLLKINTFLFFILFFLTLIIVVKYKLYKKGYYYFTSILITYILFRAPFISDFFTGDFMNWFIHFAKTALYAGLFVHFYLAPRLKEECNKMLFILPIAYLFLVSSVDLLLFCLVIVYLYFNPLGDITAFVFFKAMFGITPLEELPSL